jgi:hypothetical protein
MHFMLGGLDAFCPKQCRNRSREENALIHAGLLFDGSHLPETGLFIGEPAAVEFAASQTSGEIRKKAFRHSGLPLPARCGKLERDRRLSLEPT